MKTVIILKVLIFSMLLFSCTNDKTEAKLKSENNLNSVSIDFIGFKNKVGTDNDEFSSNPFDIEITNNRDESIYFITLDYDSTYIVPEKIRKYREKNLLSTSTPENWKFGVAEVHSKSQRNFSMGSFFIKVPPKADVFEFLICYFFSPTVEGERRCQTLKYKLEGNLIKEVD